MAIKKQTLRKEVKVYSNKELLTKEEIITLSESWSEAQEIFFRKMLKQGGKFKVKGTPFEVKLEEKILRSTGEKDGGVVQIPGFGSQF